MSFYRSLLAAIAAIAITSPVFAADNIANPADNANSNDEINLPQQLADNATGAQAPTDESHQMMATDHQSAAAATDKVSINTATAKELAKVKGLNAAKAKAIVAYRKKHGDFKSLDDLAHVKGFSKMKKASLDAIKEQLSI